jgi:hypothetical protein
MLGPQPDSEWVGHGDSALLRDRGWHPQMPRSAVAPELPSQAEYGARTGLVPFTTRESLVTAWSGTIRG